MKLKTTFTFSQEDICELITKHLKSQGVIEDVTIRFDIDPGLRGNQFEREVPPTVRVLAETGTP